MINAICALTARQLSMVGHGGDMWEAAAVRYYGQSLHHLINTFADSVFPRRYPGSHYSS